MSTLTTLIPTRARYAAMLDERGRELGSRRKMRWIKDPNDTSWRGLVDDLPYPLGVEHPHIGIFSNETGGEPIAGLDVEFKPSPLDQTDRPVSVRLRYSIS